MEKDTLCLNKHRISIRKSKANPIRNMAAKKGGTIETTVAIAANELPQKKAIKQKYR